MSNEELRRYKLEYPDGWVETWSVPAGATSESLIAAGVQLLKEGGVKVSFLGVFGRASTEAEFEEQPERTFSDEGNHASAQAQENGKPSAAGGDPESNSSRSPEESVKPRAKDSRAQKDRNNARRREQRKQIAEDLQSKISAPA